MTQNDPPDRLSEAGAWRALDHTVAEARAGFTDLAPEAMEALVQEAVTSTRHARKASATKAPHVDSRLAVTRKSSAASPATIVRSVEDADRLMALIRGSAARVHDWVAAQTGDPLDVKSLPMLSPISRPIVTPLVRAEPALGRVLSVVRDDGAVGKWPAGATAKSLAEAGHLSTAGAGRDRCGPAVSCGS